MFFFVNAKGKGARVAKRRKRSSSRKRRSGGRRRGRFVKGSAAAKRYMASIRPKRARRNPVARKRRKSRRHSHAVTHHRRRSYRRNPSFRLGGGGLMRTITQGAKCGAFVTLGEGLSAAVPGFVGLPTTGLLGFAARIAAGTLIGTLGKGVLGSQNAEYVVAGAFSGVYRQLVRQFNVPILAPALAGYPGVVQMRGYVPAAPRAIAPAGMRAGSTVKDAGRAAGQLF